MAARVGATATSALPKAWSSVRIVKGVSTAHEGGAWLELGLGLGLGGQYRARGWRLETPQRNGVTLLTTATLLYLQWLYLLWLYLLTLTPERKGSYWWCRP